MERLRAPAHTNSAVADIRPKTRLMAIGLTFSIWMTFYRHHSGQAVHTYAHSPARDGYSIIRATSILYHITIPAIVNLTYVGPSGSVIYRRDLLAKRLSLVRHYPRIEFFDEDMKSP